MGRIKAYTLMEVTVAMLLSAICIGICYSAYGIIGNYYASFHQKNEKADALLSLRQVLGKDFQKSKLVLTDGEGLAFQQDSVIVRYRFDNKQISREFGSLRTDTFKVDWTAQYVGFAGFEVPQADTIDLLKFNIHLDTRTQVPLIFYKHYSAQDLFQ